MPFIDDPFRPIDYTETSKLAHQIGRAAAEKQQELLLQNVRGDIQERMTKAFGDATGPFGYPMPSAVAKEVDALIAGLSSDCKGLISNGPVRIAKTPSAFEFIEGERADVSVIATDDVDHDREVIIVKGIRLDAFKKTGMPVTWAHNYTALPVGHGMWIKHDADKTRLLAKTHYYDRPEDWQGDWMADAVFHLIKNGSMLGKSIGFIPMKVHAPTPDDLKKRPELADATLVFDEVVMIEYAVTPVPANPNAIVQAVGKAIRSGVGIPDLILDDFGITFPSPPPGIDWKALGLDEEITEDIAAELSKTNDLMSTSEVKELVQQAVARAIADIPALLKRDVWGY
jgi:hypothetical protein